MSLARLMKALYRGGGDDIENNLSSDKRQNLLVAQGAPPYVEMSRRGIGAQAMTTAAVAALVVRPSTVALATLFNNEPEGGKIYVVDRAFAFNLVSTAAQARHGIWLCSHPKGLVTPTNEITARGSYAARANYGGRAFLVVDMTVTDDGWFPWGTWGDVEPTGVLPGGILTVHIEGRLLVPPQCGVSGTVVSSVVGNTFTFGFSWYEMQLDMA